MNEINAFILHCSANGPNSRIGAYEIRKYHTLPVSAGGRGWEDIGYHFVIKTDGTVEQGRKLEYQGAHCTGHNRLSIGICLVGGVDVSGQPQDNFTFLQFEALAMMLRELRKRWPKAVIYGHNEFANKACPVFDVPAFLKRYGIAKDPSRPEWDAKRWPHFRAKEFSGLWGEGDMPGTWANALDALEALRAAYGHPLVIAHSEWKESVPALIVDLRIPAADRQAVIRMAMEHGFSSARALSTGVRVYMGWE
ncbi:MAG: N-acetylmuramoyl-L-alanine amidase [Desulfovibrionaceae bacterium]|nr:N-acetylmuramoyl-L-alanine amidase [Desulfovibrionaceae bacterium]